MKARAWAGAALLLGVALLFFVPLASAVVPQSKRVVAAAARTNKADHRAAALRFNLVMRIGEAEPIAEGELVTHPTGLARLELRAPGLVERHLLLGSEHSAARNGFPLPKPRSFLPPLFLLQADSATVLRTAMEAFGVEGQYIGLEPCGDDDCFVIGDPVLAVNGPSEPPPNSDEGSGGAGGSPSRSSSWSAGAGSIATEDPENAELSDYANTFSSIWVGTEDFEIKKIRSHGGVTVEFGPLVKYGKLAVPSWWIVSEADKRPVRFTVAEASEVNAPAGAFTETWLLAATIASDGPPPAESQRQGDAE